MHTVDKKSYIVIEVSKDKNKLVPMLALGMGMSNTLAVVIFSLRKENIKLFRKVCTPWAKRSKKNIGVLFLVENVQGRLRDLSALVRAAKKSFPDGVTIVVDDYHQFYRNTYDYRKNFIDFPEVLEKITKEHRGILALFSDSTECDMCPVYLKDKQNKVRFQGLPRNYKRRGLPRLSFLLPCRGRSKHYETLPRNRINQISGLTIRRKKMKKKEKTREEKFKEAQKLDQSIAKLLKKLTKIVGDREIAEGMVFFDFGYRNICGFTEFVPKGKDPNAVILKEKVGFDLRKRHEYSHETLMRIYWQLLKVGIGTTVKYLRLLDEVSMSFRDGLEIKSVEQYEKFFEKEHEEIMEKLGFRV